MTGAGPARPLSQTARPVSAEAPQPYQAPLCSQLQALGSLRGVFCVGVSACLLRDPLLGGPSRVVLCWSPAAGMWRVKARLASSLSICCIRRETALPWGGILAQLFPPTPALVCYSCPDKTSACLCLWKFLKRAECPVSLVFHDRPPGGASSVGGGGCGLHPGPPWGFLRLLQMQFCSICPWPHGLSPVWDTELGGGPELVPRGNQVRPGGLGVPGRDPTMGAQGSCCWRSPARSPTPARSQGDPPSWGPRLTPVQQGWGRTQTGPPGLGGSCPGHPWGQWGCPGWASRTVPHPQGCPGQCR